MGDGRWFTPQRGSCSCECCGGDCAGHESKVIGYDRTAWACISQWMPCAEVRLNLKDDISSLSGCDVLFMGCNQACENAIHFDSGDFATIKSWIEAGGRCYLSGEYSGCLGDLAALNAFLTSMGAGMQLKDDSYDAGCSLLGGRDCQEGAANIASGIETTRYSLTATIDLTYGGTSVFLRSAPNSNVIVAVEGLSSGFLFLSGDSNIVSGVGCGDCPTYDNSEFFCRIVTYDDADII